jgi:hypothetical protein
VRRKTHSEAAARAEHSDRRKRNRADVFFPKARMAVDEFINQIASLVSGYKSNRFNCLQNDSVELFDSISLNS